MLVLTVNATGMPSSHLVFALILYLRVLPKVSTIHKCSTVNKLMVRFFVYAACYSMMCICSLKTFEAYDWTANLLPNMNCILTCHSPWPENPCLSNM